ncbi:ATP-binding protein [Aestuariivirga sp.]|uniref:sensor histidine kinase n=1 Tax=Aestuariivirga sp. TaxID=2650926 RepID=UPI0039E5DD29
MRELATTDMKAGLGHVLRRTELRWRSLIARAEAPADGGPPSNSVTLPILFLFSSALVALGFARIAIDHASPTLVLGWVTAAVAASLLPLLIAGYCQRFKPVSKQASLHLHEFCTILLGLVWAAFPALFFDAGAELRLLAVAITFGISGLGSLALARVQSSAILFCALIAGSLILASIKIGGTTGIALGAFSLLYCLSVAIMILHAHEAARLHAHAEDEIKKQNEIISLLLSDADESEGNWLWETDGQGRIVYASPSLFNALNIKPAAITGRLIADAMCEVPDDPGWNALLATMRAYRPVDGHRVTTRLGGHESWWRITAKPMFDADGNFSGYRGAAHNITGDHRTETKLIEAKEAAEKASETKSQFLAVMSHELRTPLNAIVGFAELLISPHADAITEAQRIDHLNTILGSSKHLQSLISDILDATRIEKGTLQLVEQEADAAELVEIAAKMCRDAAEKTDTTIIARIVDGVEVKGDITRIKQILINLISNAVKFSPSGGFVNISLERTDTGGLAIAVRDEGVGIRKEDIDRIFEPFVQADAGHSRRFGGIGLGLAIARRIAMLHGGTVTIESEYGVGTTARLVLPAWRITWHVDRAAA